MYYYTALVCHLMLDMNVVILDFVRSQPYSFNSLSYCSNLISRILNVATLFYLHLSILIYTYPFELGCNLLVSCSSFIVVHIVLCCYIFVLGLLFVSKVYVLITVTLSMWEPLHFNFSI